MRFRKTLAFLAAPLLFCAAPALAAEGGAGPDVIRLWPGAAPGTQDWTGPETSDALKMQDGRSFRTIGNVTVPTLSVYRPAPGTANTTAVLICPGGGFQYLAIEHEGEMVARWLAQRGVTAVILKYRVHSIPTFAYPVDLLHHPERFTAFAQSFEAGRPIAIADGLQAMHYLRAHADDLGIAPDRIGMIGFSAGAITTMGVVLTAEIADRPNFAAPIYGAAIETKAPPKDGPPLFLAATQDDDAVPVGESINIFSQWTKANLPAEIHIYQKGGHGFGMIPMHLPLDGWTVAFAAWLKAGGWLAAPKAA